MRAVLDLYGCWGAGTNGWPTVTIFTDGSVQGRGPLEAAGWAVLIMDDWFMHNWRELPCEGGFRGTTLREATYMHGHQTMSEQSEDEISSPDAAKR